MKHLKTFENLKEPQVGDYVAVVFSNNHAISKELENSIGEIIKVYSEKMFLVVFGTVNFYVKREEIIFFSPNKKDLEIQLKANKYNL